MPDAYGGLKVQSVWSQNGTRHQETMKMVNNGMIGSLKVYLEIGNCEHVENEMKRDGRVW